MIISMRSHRRFEELRMSLDLSVRSSSTSNVCVLTNYYRVSLELTSIICIWIIHRLGIFVFVTIFGPETVQSIMNIVQSGSVLTFLTRRTIVLWYTDKCVVAFTKVASFIIIIVCYSNMDSWTITIWIVKMHALSMWTIEDLLQWSWSS